MRIAIAHDYLMQFGGAERTLLALCEVYPDAPIFTLIYNKDVMSSFFKDKVIYTSFLDKFPNFFKNNPRLLLPLIPLAALSIKISGYDVVISSSSAFIKGIRTDSGTKHISYCYSPTRFLWDYKDTYLKDNNYNFLIRFLTYPLLYVLQKWDMYIAKKIDVWIAPSQIVQERIKKFYNTHASVVYPPINLPFHKTNKESNYAHDFFLIVSRLSAYKKIDLVIKTFNKLQLPLVIIGDGPEKKKLQDIARSNIIFKGFVNDKDLQNFYQHAYAVIMACEEDFGLVAVEAASYGIPTLAFKRGGITEWLEPGKSGEFFEEQSEESIAQGVYKIFAQKYNSTYIIKKSELFTKTNFKNSIAKIIKNNYSNNLDS